MDAAKDWLSRQYRQLDARSTYGALILLLAFKLLYVPCELSLNSVLAETYSIAPSDLRLHTVEFLGRATSGVAVFVLALRLGFNGSVPVGRWALGATSFMLMASVAAVVFGQKAIVDRVAAHSSPSARHDAILLRTLPMALRASRTSIAGFALHGDGADARTYFAIAPALEFYDVWESRHLAKHLDEVLYGETLAAAMSGNDAPAWREYRDESNDFHHLYARYANASRRARNFRSEADRFTSETYDTIRQLGTEAHARFEDGTSDVSVAGLHERLRRYFAYRVWFPRRAQREYDDAMQAIAGEVIDPSTWCAISCPGDQAYVRSRLRYLLIQSSLQRQGIDPRLSFDTHRRDLSNLARRAIAKFGGRLPRQWRLSSRAAYASEARRSIGASLRNAISISTQGTFGRPIASGLSYVAFALEPAVQREQRTSLLHRFGIAVRGPVSPDWSRGTFDRIILWPALQRARAQKRGAFGPDEAYRDGGRLAARGRDAVVALLVPVVSLMLSLFFGLWNVVSAATLAFTLRDAHRFERVMQRWTWAGGLAICCLPLLLPIGLAASPGFGPAISHVRERSPTIGYVFDWIGRAEPSFLGVANLSRFLVFQVIGTAPERFARANYHVLAAADCIVIHDCRASTKP